VRSEVDLEAEGPAVATLPDRERRGPQSGRLVTVRVTRAGGHPEKLKYLATANAATALLMTADS